MKLTERYSFTYGKYQSYGATIELEEGVLKELPDELRVSGLRAKIATHLETSLTEKELKKAHAFFQTEAGKKLGVASSYSTHNYPELDMYAAQWGSERNNKLKEIIRLRNFGGKEAMPYVKNLRNIVSACQQYMLEEGKKEASLHGRGRHLLQGNRSNQWGELQRYLSDSQRWKGKRDECRWKSLRIQILKILTSRSYQFRSLLRRSLHDSPLRWVNKI